LPVQDHFAGMAAGPSPRTIRCCLRRLELLGDAEHLPYMRSKADARADGPPDGSATKPSRPAAVQNQLICALKPSQPRRSQGAPSRRSESVAIGICRVGATV